MIREAVELVVVEFEVGELFGVGEADGNVSSELIG